MTEDKIKAAAEIYCDKPYNTSLEKQQAYRSFLNGALSPQAKEYWQQGMYTSEEVLNLLNRFDNMKLRPERKLDFEDIRTWFNQNKNK